MTTPDSPSQRSDVAWFLAPCPPPSQQARSQASARQATLTKPPGSLGRLEELAIDFAGFQATELPAIDIICIRIFAADHGVCAQGVSAFPQAVTAQMVANFAAGGAAISVLARRLHADFGIVDVGTIGPHIDAPAVTNASIAAGTADFTTGEAMSDAQLGRALQVGADHVPADADLLIGGEMAIGNTTSAAAICAALLEIDAADAVGPGTGVDTDGLQRKAAAVATGLERHRDRSPLGVLRCLGGFEIAALAGAYVKAAQQQTPVLVDGFICTAAALVACHANPSVGDWMLFAHRSAEPAHSAALDALGATPLLDLELRLGEGSGAALAVPLLTDALALHASMATFADAGVSDGK